MALSLHKQNEVTPKRETAQRPLPIIFLQKLPFLFHRKGLDGTTIYFFQDDLGAKFLKN